MKILIVSEMSVPYAVGGGEVRYGLLARELANRGHDVTWLSMRQRSSPDEETIEGVRHLHQGPRIANPPSRPLVAMLRFMLTAFWQVLTHRYDVIDCQTYAPLPAAWLASVLSRQKMVATIHDVSSRDADQWLSARDRFIVAPIETLLYRLPYWRIVTVSTAVGRALTERFGVAEQRVRVVPNGVDIAAIDAVPPAPQAVDLIYVGRIVPHKHVEDFLEAIARVAATREASGGPMVAAAVVGGGPLLAEMRTLAERLGIAHHVEFTGDLPAHTDVIARIKSARVLVLPSTREGFGLVLAEAMACGTACVAYDVPAVREVLADGEAGVLVAQRNVDDLTAAVEQLLADPVRQGRHIPVGQRRVATQFSASRFARLIERAYTS